METGIGLTFISCPVADTERERCGSPRLSASQAPRHVGGKEETLQLLQIALCVWGLFLLPRMGLRSNQVMESWWKLFPYGGGRAAVSHG